MDQIKPTPSEVIVGALTTIVVLCIIVGMFNSCSCHDAAPLSQHEQLQMMVHEHGVDDVSEAVRHLPGGLR